mgnify:CR=1 FL=1
MFLKKSFLVWFKISEFFQIFHIEFTLWISLQSMVKSNFKFWNLRKEFNKFLSFFVYGCEKFEFISAKTPKRL